MMSLKVFGQRKNGVWYLVAEVKTEEFTQGYDCLLATWKDSLPEDIFANRKNSPNEKPFLLHTPQSGNNPLELLETSPALDLCLSQGSSLPPSQEEDKKQSANENSY